jgi:hypothetical protein
MRFDYPTAASPTASYVFTNDPEAPYERQVVKHNTEVMMEDGSVYVYARAVTSYRYVISSIVLESQSERDDLETFYDSTVNGSEKQFEYTDPYDNTYTVRFEDDLTITEIFKGRFYRATFNLLETP